MNDKTLVRINAIAATDRLHNELSGAREWLREHTRDARIFKLPYRQLGEEEVPNSPVQEDNGKPAIDSAIRSLCRIEYDECQHPLSTLRYPGVLVVPEDFERVLVRVNEAKQALADAMYPITEANWRIWRAEIPSWRRLNRIQAYRYWRGFTDSPCRISFTWAGQSRGGEQLRIGALSKRLERELRNGGNERIEAELDFLAGYDPDEVVVIRRPVSPTPIANLVFEDGTRRLVKPSTLPLMMPRMPKLKPLPELMLDQDRDMRDDQNIECVLVRSWHVWRYRSWARFTLSGDPVTARLKTEGDGSVAIVTRSGERRTMNPNADFENSLEEIMYLVGPSQAPASLDSEDELAIVAANKMNGYVHDRRDDCIWRIPKRDLVASVRA